MRNQRIFDEGESWQLSWLKAMPWLTAGFLVGTPRWAAAVISIAVSHASQLYEDHAGLKGGMEESLKGLGMSPRVHNDRWASSTRPRLRDQRRSMTGQRRVRSKTVPTNNKLVARYERGLTSAGVPYFYDHVNKSRSWDAPEQQQMCLKITDLPLSKKWEEKQQEGRTLYVNQLTEETTDTRPGPAEIWVVKRKVKPDWVRSAMMALPHGWEMRRTQVGEMFYLNHNEDPSSSTTTHPMRHEIEDERRRLLPEWNVEWDHDRGKKYRRVMTREIRWKAVDGPRYELTSHRARITFENSQDSFIEPLPPGWTLRVKEDGQTIYKNGKVGKERIERTTHPLTDKRRKLLPEWEMRYTPNNRRYWVHYGSEGRGTTWWTRNRLLKNTSLKNNASGWKLAKTGFDWEWFEGGDVPHSEIPVLDLDDPAEVEFREYPFILPPRIVDENGAFIEPLPPNWVRRNEEDGTVYYWDFKDEVRSGKHPFEEERRSLPALWEMRFTRYSRQYFIHHEDGSTWWTSPREAKYKQILRARPGQKQDGWKIAEDGKTWDRFEDHPNAHQNTLSPTQSIESESSRGERTPETSRSFSSPREWLKSVNSGEIVTNARNHLSKRPTLFPKFSRLPSINSNASPNSHLAESPQDIVEGEREDQGEGWLSYASKMTEGPPLNEEPEQATTLQMKGTKESLAPATLENSPQEAPKRESSVQETHQADMEPTLEEPLSKDWPDTASTAQLHSNEASSTASTPHLQSDEASNTTSPFKKDLVRGWAKRTTSHLHALKGKHKSKHGSKDASVVAPEKVALEYDLEPQPAVDGLGITCTEASDSGVGAKLLAPLG